MSLTLNAALTDLANGDITLVNGTIAQLTRETYLAPYTSEVNYQQYVPIIYFNIIDSFISIANTNDISFNQNDIFVQDDYVVLNEASE